MRLLKSSSIRSGEKEILTKLFGREKPEASAASGTIPAPKDRTVMSGGRHLRHELKYLINEGTYRYLKSRLLPLMSPDDHGADGEYRVTSLYFDDEYNSAYWQKLNGAEVRRKFRIRAYGLDGSLIKLESKHKDLDYISKLSQTLTAEQYAALLCGDCSFMAEHDGEEDVFGEFYRTHLTQRLRPKVIADYRREALVYPFGNVRITFDKGLAACFNTADMFSPDARYLNVYGKEIILEVKFDNYIPDSIQSALQCLNAPMQPFSKYIICTDKMLEVKCYG